MTESCDRFQELILDGLSGVVTADQERQVATHVAQCAACRELQQAVQQDDRQLADYADSVSRSVGDLPERTVAAFQKSAVETPRPIPLWRKIMRSRICRISTAAAVLAAVVAVFLPTGRQIAWAQIAEALQKVQRVHIVEVTTMPDGKTEKQEWWFEKPNHLRAEDSLTITVDDGVNRLFLDRRKNRAQLSDSALPDNPIEQNGVFKSISILEMVKAGDPDVSMKLTPLPDEKGGAVKVYTFEIASKTQNLSGKGKLWIAADTKLPMRFEGQAHKEGEAGPGRAIERTWSYDPIPAELFSTAVPPGYTEAPRKQRGALKGRVLDEQGAPVAGAVVYATNMYTRVNFDSGMDATSDAQGNFEIKLPVEGGRQGPMFFPVFVSAFRRDDPQHVAWTLITDPKDKAPRSELIPGDPGRVQVVTNGSPTCGGTTGMVLKMQPAGQIHGIVTSEDGTPIRGAAINLRQLMEESGGPVRLNWIKLRGPCSTKAAFATTDAQGRYELNVPRFWGGVTFFMSARAEDWVTKDDSFKASGPLDSQEMNFRLYKAAFTVTGRATNDRGEPLAGYEVAAVVEGIESRSCAKETGSDGRFTLTGCPETPNLRIRLKSDEPPGSRMLNPTKDFYPQVEAGIKYEAGTTKYEVNLVAETPMVTLRVVLKDSAGRPVPYFPVQLRNGRVGYYWSECRLSKRTDRSGVCALSGVPRSEEMTLWLSSDNNFPTNCVAALTPEQQKVAAGNAGFRPVEPLVMLPPDRKEMTIEATLLTFEEWKALNMTRDQWKAQNVIRK